MDCSQSKRPRVSSPDDLLESFLSLPSLYVDLSFDRIVEARSDDEQIDVIEKAMRLGKCLLEAGKRFERRRAALHNSVAWCLPADLTIKIFSVMDTQSVCYAGAASSFFRKCAEDPLCYSNIDLVTKIPKVNNLVVSTMIQRAGKALRSLKLGMVPGPPTSTGGSQQLTNTIRNTADASGFSWNDKRSRQGKESSILTRSCLSSLDGDGGAPGSFLRRLHLYNIERMDNAALAIALTACPALLDLEIVGIHVELRQTLESVSIGCPLIERLHFESSRTGRDDSLKLPTCSDLVSNCPHLTSLALKGFKLPDSKIRILVKGFRKLRYVDLSTSYSITGTFLRNLGTNAGGNLLEILILRDCMHLKEVEVAKFLTAVVGGDFKLLRHLDISNREGLASEGDWFNRCYSTSFIPAKQLFEGRPRFQLLAEFPQEAGLTMLDGLISSSDPDPFSSPSTETSSSNLSSAMVTSSDSSYNTDPGSGNDDARDPHYVVYEESSDDLEFLLF